MHFTELDEGPVERVLITHLVAVATKDVRQLRNAFTADALFVGTDDTEQWSVDRLIAVLEDSENGWNMLDCTERIICFIDGHGCVATFFETLAHEDFGPLRGSGVVIKNNTGEWRIAQYVLSFSVPNSVVDTTDILTLLVP
ncbi:MAG: nuclear transport factor 2 family protein [Parcubacteria group bacterium]|nr:nuclear transport factor 2 family protein [Parcubacteria group bacterium]